VSVTPSQKLVPVDLQSHHAQCELNFHRLLGLMPNWEEGEQQWTLAIGSDGSFTVRLRVVDSARYTTTVEVIQQQPGLEPPKLVIRLYHDAAMAEIISWDRHRHWKPQYSYPNPQMYQPDEKLELNRFLGDWLEICHSQGYPYPDICETVLDNKK